MYQSNKRNGQHSFWFKQHSFVECMGVIVGILVTLLIIDPNNISIMSVKFPNHRVTNLRVLVRSEIVMEAKGSQMIERESVEIVAKRGISRCSQKEETERCF